MKREVNSYPDDFRLKVVQDYLMSDATMSDIQKKYGIRDKSSISQ